MCRVRLRVAPVLGGTRPTYGVGYPGGMWGGFRDADRIHRIADPPIMTRRSGHSQLTQLQSKDSIAGRGEAWVVRCDDRRQAILRVHFAQQRVK